MGEIAEDIIDGLCCSLCGVYFAEEHGFPVFCGSCHELHGEDGETPKATHPEL